MGRRAYAGPSLRPFFKFFGGKWRVARRYPEPAHDTIVEPFAGSAGYSLRYPDRQVVLRDADEFVVGVWSYLIRTSADEIRRLPLIGMDQTVDDLDVCQEARWLIGFWVNSAGAQPKKSPSAWMRSGVSPGSFWGEAARERIATQVRAIRHWRVEHVRYEDSDVNFPATWFVDPPYRQAGKHYRFDSSAIDFDHLGAWCRSLPGDVIVCENTGADWLPFDIFGDIKATHGSRRSGKSSEVIWFCSDGMERSAAQ